MATATVTTARPSPPSFPVYNAYEYSRNSNAFSYGLPSSSVRAIASLGVGKENLHAHVLKHAKANHTAPQHDIGSSSGHNNALRPEHRLARNLGLRPYPKPSRLLSSRNIKRTAVENPAVEDWSEDFALDDDANPFLVPDEEFRNISAECSKTVVDEVDRDCGTTKVPLRADYANTAVASNALIAANLHLSDHPQENAERASWSAPWSALSSNDVLPPFRSTHGALNRHYELPYSWERPGPSPLSCDISTELSSTEDEVFHRFLGLYDPSDDEDDDGVCFRPPPRGSSLRPHRLRILPLPRTLGGKKGGRVASPLHRAFHKNRFLSRVCFLDVEAPELDFADERSVEFLLDTQDELMRGQVIVPNLASYALIEPSKLGTSPRRLQWAQGSTFPRRVKDYGKAAEAMLAHRRTGGARR